MTKVIKFPAEETIPEQFRKIAEKHTTLKTFTLVGFDEEGNYVLYTNMTRHDELSTVTNVLNKMALEAFDVLEDM